MCARVRADVDALCQKVVEGLEVPLWPQLAARSTDLAYRHRQVATQAELQLPEIRSQNVEEGIQPLTLLGQRWSWGRGSAIRKIQTWQQPAGSGKAQGGAACTGQAWEKHIL